MSPRNKVIEGGCSSEVFIFLGSGLFAGRCSFSKEKRGKEICCTEEEVIMCSILIFFKFLDAVLSPSTRDRQVLLGMAEW